MKLLYIGEKQDKVVHGWDQVNKRNQVVVEQLFDVVDYLPLEFHTFLGKVYIGITDVFLKKLDMVLLNNYDYIFVCQSTCGRVCKHIKKKYPQIKLITFFHNIEKYYAKQYLNVSGIKALPYYIRASIFEKMAVKYSDYCITLNERDSNLLKDIYGKPADAIMPTSLEDKFQNKDSLTKSSDDLIDYLFVGTAFYPNVEGVQWFINCVMPKVRGKLTVVGKGMRESLFSNLNDRISIYGFVDDLSDYYRRSKCVVSPIFHGGGMKTKTAEALMYGKFILATKEALVGYVVDTDCMKECQSADEFVESIAILEESHQTFYQQSRDIFLQYCSYNSSLGILEKLLRK